jgi:NitT/TauT family transport system ATP-binding protein
MGGGGGLGGAVQGDACVTVAIRFERVSKTYAVSPVPLVAVSDASFSLEDGEFLAILGPSGCGKSTLLMMAAGLEAPTAGVVEVRGTRLLAPRAQTGIMFQDATLLPWMSVLDNVLFPATIRRLRRAAVEPRARALLATMGLAGFESRRPHELSGGMRQRVAICRALVLDPDVLLMDEPFSALDAITRDEMGAVLLDLWQHQTKSAIFVTHSIREAVLLADRILVMSPRPARVSQEVVVPFPRPRAAALADTVAFGAVCAELRGMISHDMAAA